MALPQSDMDYLEQRGQPFVISNESNMTCVVFPAFNLPVGYNIGSSDLLIRLNPGFPDVPPDMWWFAPAVHRTNGIPIPATDHNENHLGRSWQRWSRHLANGQWQPGTDSLQSFMAIIQRDLDQYKTEVIA